jgi:glutamyl-tRNA synthetase
LIRERLVTLDDCVPFAAFFFRDNVDPKKEDLIAKGLDAARSAEVARKSYEILSGLPEITHAVAEPPMRAYVESSGFSASQVFGILRVATTGQKVSPPLFESMEVIGRERVLQRIENAIQILESV